MPSTSVLPKMFTTPEIFFELGPFISEKKKVFILGDMINIENFITNISWVIKLLY